MSARRSHWMLSISSPIHPTLSTSSTSLYYFKNPFLYYTATCNKVSWQASDLNIFLFLKLCYSPLHAPPILIWPPYQHTEKSSNNWNPHYDNSCNRVHEYPVHKLKYNIKFYYILRHYFIHFIRYWMILNRYMDRLIFKWDTPVVLNIS
jgi:hypothetical protein